MRPGNFGVTGLPWAQKLTALAATAAVALAGAAAVGMTANAAELDDAPGAQGTLAPAEAELTALPESSKEMGAGGGEGSATGVADVAASESAAEALESAASEEPAAGEAAAAEGGSSTLTPSIPQATDEATVAEDAPAISPSASEEPSAQAEVTAQVSAPAEQAPPAVALNTPEEGTFQVKVVVEGGPASAATHNFKIGAVCNTPGGETKYWNQNKVKGDGVPVGIGGSFPVGSNCWVWEWEDKAQLPGYAVEFTGQQSLVIKAGETPVVTFTNKYTDQFGTLEVKKTVSGGPAGAVNAEYGFAVVCGQVVLEVEVKGDGVPVPVGYNLPAGTKCVVKEFFTKPVDGFLAVPPPPQTVTIEAGKTTLVEFENTFTNQYGFVQLKKTVLGGPSTRARDFLVKLKCGDLSASVRMPPGLLHIRIPVPAGMQCTLTEDLDDAQIPGYTLIQPKMPTVTVVAGETVIVEIVNEYKDIVPQPSATPSETATVKPSETATVKPSETATVKPSETATASPGVSASSHPKGKDGKFAKGTSLARTGSDAIVVGSIAVALLAGGVLLILVRRNRSK
ncbi:DUF5979 domain-containing protein [Buchananella felis]|uniref:DUF5979 domain-containing protein n=1 Tax=Buchananella felis TaxID=3231492 RepID=UPI003528DC45